MWFQKLLDRLCRVMAFVMVVFLAAMVVMVFGNVVLRYAFDSGIGVSEELSRYFFVWLTYAGAMVAMRERGHLGVDTFVKLLPLAGKKGCVLLRELMMLGCNGLFLWGTFQMHEVQRTNVSPVAGLSMIWVFGVGYVVAVVMGAFNLRMLWRLATGRLSEDEMSEVVEAEGMKEAQVAIDSTAGARR